MARRSARLASLTKTATQAPDAPALSSVAEHDENPPKSPPPSARQTAANIVNAILSSPVRGPKTPGGSSPMKPPMSEMHPSKVHPTMGPPSSGLRLGFTDIKLAAARDEGLPVAAQTTPSRVKISSSPFNYRVTGQTPIADLGLGPDAQRIMDGLREDAARIKEELRAQHEAEAKEEENAAGRKIAQPKGKAGRFSAAHMAQFKKMDSIANHPSAFRGLPGRTTPLKAGVKRNQSNADLDEPETARSKAAASSASKPTPAQAIAEEPAAVTKRARQHIDDDATSKRPASRDGSSIPVPKSAGGGIPRSKSNLASLMTPTKSSLSRTNTVKTPSQGLLARSPSKATLSGIPRSATTGHLTTTTAAAPPAAAAEVTSPKGRFDRVKAMFRGTKAPATKPKSTIPLPSAFASKTPAPARPPKELFTAPLTTPGRKLTKRVAFTPDTRGGTAPPPPHSPSPVKSALPQSRIRPAEVHYPSLDSIMADSGIAYPDLSARRPLPEPPAASATVPGEFTFRSNHTISFSAAPKPPSFGSSPGQASIRAVRPSLFPNKLMPGSFPSAPTTTPAADASDEDVNKENEAPPPRSTTGGNVFPSLPHGMSTKKRRRVSTDEEEAEREEAERAAKKRRGEAVPEGAALLAPRLVAATAAAGGGNLGASPRRKAMPGQQVAGTPSPMKRKGISVSRLNLLARPKLRK
ncbi:hypothetical protein C8A05DRAFT_13075 [Staphylotrichum tortipilum]|uniref:Erythromycin esterase n=1 Tax=Staphylotrichum tortipilum TaxID=2831512 RepID=A0AAN6MQ78_9PEZI|nr:hypothetical protein C8A05DRAFT_13075 [Staphylotrichum longicolle]